MPDSIGVPNDFFEVAPKLTTSELRVLVALLILPDGKLTITELSRRTGMNRNQCGKGLRGLDSLGVIDYVPMPRGFSFSIMWRNLWGGPSLDELRRQFEKREDQKTREKRESSDLIAFYAALFKKQYGRTPTIGKLDVNAAKMLLRRLCIEDARQYIEEHLPPASVWPLNLLGIWDRWKAENQEKSSAVHRAASRYQGPTVHGL